jgi:hypothetical protein
MRQDAAVPPEPDIVAAPSEADDARFRLPTRDESLVALGYAAAAALYILIGVFVTDFLLSVFVAIAYLLVVAWLVPTVIRRVL